MWFLKYQLKIVICASFFLYGCHKHMPPPPATPKPKTLDKTLTEQAVRPTEDKRLGLVLDTLWQSDLGQTYYDYLYGDPEAHATSRDVVDRVLSDGGASVTKMSAIQLLTEQLYDKHLIAPEQVRKLLVLQGDIHQRQNDLAKSPTEHMAYIALGTFLTLIPFGFPATRSAMIMLARSLPRFVQPRAVRDYTAANQNFSLTSFEPKFVIQTFFKYFGPFSMLYFAWFDWKESTRGHSIPYTLESLKTEKEFSNFILDLYKL